VVHSFIGFSKFVGTCENGGGGTYMGMMNEFQENHGLDWDGRTCKKGAHARKESGRRVAGQEGSSRVKTSGGGSSVAGAGRGAVPLCSTVLRLSAAA
jgi:hypothetical protein